MPDPNAGYFYDLRMKLRKHLVEKHRRPAHEFGWPDYEVWTLLNEMDQLTKLIAGLAPYSPYPGTDFELSVRHAVLRNQQARKAECADESPKTGAGGSKASL